MTIQFSSFEEATPCAGGTLGRDWSCVESVKQIVPMLVPSTNGLPMSSSFLDSLSSVGFVEERCDDILTKVPPSFTKFTTLHDHNYEKQTAVVYSSCSSDSEENSSSLDDSLQNLFDNCDVDPEFLAGAKPTFKQFLEDVMDNSEVPSDEMFCYLDDLDCPCQVPTKSSNCLACLPPSPCLFTSAGSTETRLSASVASSPMSLPLRSPADRSSPPASSEASLESKLQEILSWSLFPNSDWEASVQSGLTTAQTSDMTSFLEDVTLTAGEIRLNAQRQPPRDNGSVETIQPVTASHPIQNGVCLFCCSSSKQIVRRTNSSSVAEESKTVSDDLNQVTNLNSVACEMSTQLLIAEGRQTCSQFPHSAPILSLISMGKRKGDSSSPGENCVVVCKQAKVETSQAGSTLSAETEGAKNSVGEVMTLNSLKSSPSPVVAEQENSAFKRHGELLTCVYFKNEKLVDLHPLSPVSINHFGRCV